MFPSPRVPGSIALEIPLPENVTAVDDERDPELENAL